MAAMKKVKALKRAFWNHIKAKAMKKIKMTKLPYNMNAETKSTLNLLRPKRVFILFQFALQSFVAGLSYKIMKGKNLHPYSSTDRYAYVRSSA